MRSTTSRRSVAALEPFTVEHFAAYCHALRLDNGERFELEEFQREVAADLFAGVDELWMVVPEGNGKTTFMSALALYHGDYTGSAFVPIGASSREQAEIMYRQAEGLVFRTPGLKERFKCQEGYRRIKCLRTGGRIQVYAADDRTADGVIPTLALLDELHRHRNLRLYRTWRGKLLKRGGQIATISTAGEPGSEFEDTRARMKQHADEVRVSGCHTRAVSGSAVLHDWSVPRLADAENFELVAAANPLPSLTPAVLRAKRESPTMSREHWLRFVCNVATSFGGNAITAEEVDALIDPDAFTGEEELLPGFGWIDLGWQIDTSAVGVLLWESTERRLVPAPVVLEPPVDEARIVEAVLDAEERYPNLKGWVADPNAGAQQMIQLLEKGEHPLQVARGVGPLRFEAFAHSQDNAPMARGAARLDEAIRNGWLVLDGDRVLRRHLLNMHRRSLGGEKYRFDRPGEAKGEKRAQYPNDAGIGLLMGNNIAVDMLGAESVYERRGALAISID